MQSFLASCLFASALAASGDYDYAENGANWADQPINFLCGNGTQQSPIDLTGARHNMALNLDVNVTAYNNFTAGQVQKLTHTVQVDLTSGSFEKTFQTTAASKFVAKQLHFHSPSEHTIDGKHCDIEMHIVHSYEDGSYGGVIGIMFDREAGDEENAFIKQIEPVFALGEQRLKTTASNINVRSFLEGIDMEAFYSYDGSLTTPPCTEGIKWSVLKQVLPLSTAQFDKFSAQWGEEGNNRVVQELNGRTIFAEASSYTMSAAIIGAAILTQALF